MLIPEHKIEEVLNRVDLVALVSRHVELKKTGRSFKGCCPFHQEKSPSFHVTPEMGRFKCFGCQAGGDAIAFVQRYFGKSFTDAVKDLARESGVELESAQDPTALERQQLKDATDVAAEHFRTALWDSPLGGPARAYLEGRGLLPEVSKAFGLGYAPLEWEALSKKLFARGILEWGLKAGLVARRSKGDGSYDMFRGRLMIPIRSPEGRTIAFGARLLEGEEGPKYLNSRESALYNKSDVLYGGDQARDEIRRTKTAILVEGYFDCIGLHQAGVKNTVALCSTALTSGHLTLLTRMEAKELVLLLDGDDAGRKAVERLAGSLLNAGIPTRVAVLPQGEDPDTFARRVGPEGVKALLAKAEPLSRHLFVTVLPGGKDSSFEEKLAALARLKPVIAALPIGLYRTALLTAFSQHTGLPAGELEVTLRGKPAAPLQSVPKPSAALAKPPERPAELLESVYVAAVIREPKLLALDGLRVGDELRHAGLRSAVASVHRGEGGSDVLDEASDGVRKALEAAARHLPLEVSALEEGFLAICRKLKLRRVDEQLSYISKTTGQLTGSADLTEETKKLQEQRVELLALRRRVLEEAPSGTK